MGQLKRDTQCRQMERKTWYGQLGRKGMTACRKMENSFHDNHQISPLHISLELYYVFVLFCELNANRINVFYMLLKLPLI